MIHYILQIIAFQLLFLIVYDVFLKKELYFNWNRAYLLITPILSFILPLIKIGFIRNNIPEQFVIQLPAVILGTNSVNEITRINLDEILITGTSGLSTEFIILLIWITGMLVSLGFFIFKLIKIQKLKKKGIITKFNKTTIVTLPKTDVSFSFLNTIFLGESLSEVQKETILLHESIHIKEKHSFDLLFFEAIKIICWFNPLVYVFQNKMTLLQEYIADEKAASVKGKKTYYQGLLSQIFQTESISFINTFFNHSLIKKRIIMLQKSSSNGRNYKIRKLKYLLLLPIIGVMLTYTSCTQEPEKAPTNSVSEKIEKVETERYQEGSAIPFATIDRVPTYPGCSGTTNEELKKCMAKSISTFVGDNFNTKLADNVGLKGKQRISIQFKIDKNGNVTNVRARAPHKSLEIEAMRVINKLPKMKPGEQDGKPVGVLYSLPIIFKIEE